MDGPPAPDAGAAGILPEAVALEQAGITVPGRELNLLIQGLKGWCDRPAGGERRGALGLLTGEAGSGKTLLISALRTVLRSLKIRFHGTACYRDHVPLEPVRDLLAQLLSELLRSRESAPDFPGPPGWAAVEPFVPELCRLLPELPWPDPLRRFPAMDPDLDRIRVADVIAQTIAELARIAPLVLTVENLQWLDPLSSHALASLLKIAHFRAADPDPPRVLLVATLRPGEGVGLEPLLDPRLIEFQVESRGYSREDIRDRCVSLGIDLPLTVLEGLRRGSGGNPLLVLFCLGTRTAARDLDPGVLPDDPARFQEAFPGLVASRLAALDERGRTAVRLLSALGRPYPATFIESILSAAAGAAEAGPEGDAVFSRLESEGWIRRGIANDREPAWVITGELLGRAVLESLSAPERAALHRSIAEALLAQATDAPIADPPPPRKGSWNVIFHHLSQVPGHLRLVEVGLAAAREAESISAWARAIEIHERLLLAVDPRDVPLFLYVGEKLAALLESTGLHREALEIHQRLSAGRGKSFAAEGRARRLRKLGTLHGKLGELEAQARCFREGLTLFPGKGASAERLKLEAQLARLGLAGPEREESLRVLSRVEESAEEWGLPERDKLEVYRLVEEARFALGDHAEALRLLGKVFDLASSTGNRLLALESLWHQGHLHRLRGTLEEARRCLGEALDRSRRTGNRYLIARSLARMGQLLRASGEAAPALDHLNEARALFLELGREEKASRLDPAMVHLHLLLHQFHAAAEGLRRYAVQPHARELSPEARAVFPPSYPDRQARERELASLREAAARSPREGQDVQRAEILSRIAELCLDGGAAREAAALHEEALHSRGTARDAPAMARLLHRAGRHHRVLGDRSLALGLFEKSLERLSRSPDRALLGSAYLEVGSIFLVEGETGKAYEYLLRGLRLFVDEDHDQGLAVAALRLAELSREVGLGRIADLLAEAVADLCRNLGLKRWEAEAHRLLGAVASERGDYTRSARSFQRARALVEELGLALEASWLQLDLGWESYRRDNYPPALRIAREGIELARRLGARDSLEDYLFLLGAVESALPNRSKNFLRALEILNQALRGAQERARPSVEAQVLLSIALIYKERGKEAMGRKYRERARAIVATLADRLPLPIRREVESIREAPAERVVALSPVE